MTNKSRRTAMWLVLLAAAGTFALTMGTRQTMGLFLSPLNTSTGLGLASISLAFAFGQLWWGLTQPFAGAMADKVGAGRVLFAGALLVVVAPDGAAFPFAAAAEGSSRNGSARAGLSSQWAGIICLSPVALATTSTKSG